MPLRIPYVAELGLLAALAALATGACATGHALEGFERAGVAAGDVGVLPDGKVLHVASLGFERLIADLYWIRTIYYVGDEHAQAAGFPALDRLATLVTDVDPGFRTAYVVMGGALQALTGDPVAAVRLLEKGVRNVEYWKLHFLLGFNHFFEFQDYSRAAEQMQRASELGGPPYLKLLTSRLYAAGGSPETALAFVKARLAEAGSEQERELLAERYRDLWITRDLARIDAAATAYRARGLGEPAGVGELVAAGLLAPEPRDPTGGAYRLEAGRAVTDLPYDPLEVHLGAGAGRGRAQREDPR